MQPVADASVNHDVVPKWTYKTIAMEATKQRECLARNIYFEARNEPFAGQFAVAMVTLNRVHDKQFPNSICEVVYQGIHCRVVIPNVTDANSVGTVMVKVDNVANKRFIRNQIRLHFWQSNPIMQ